MRAARRRRYFVCTALLISCLRSSDTLAAPSHPALAGSVHCAYYVHSSGAFRLFTLSTAGMEDTQSGVKITETMMGSINRWYEVAFVSPEFSSKSPDQILDAMIADLTAGPYAKKKRKPSIGVRETRRAFGVDCLHAKVYYPEQAGTGVTTFDSHGKQVAADVVGHVHIIPVSDLSSARTGLAVRYILVGTMVVIPLDMAKDEGESADAQFLRELELITPSGVMTCEAADSALALWRAAAAGDIPEVERLLAAGADVDAANHDGFTPLMVAAQAGCADVVRTLVEKAPGTSITADTTRLVRVAWSGHPDIMLMLLEHGLRVNAVDPSLGETALLWATRRGDVGMTRVLLDHGADAELRSSAKPLIHAVQSNNAELVSLLVERGADVNLKTADGKTALSEAKGRGKEIEKILKQAGAH